MRERFSHLAELEAFQSREDAAFGRWADTRLDRWLVDWALRAGKEGTAKKIAREKGIEVCSQHLLDTCQTSLMFLRHSETSRH